MGGDGVMLSWAVPKGPSYDPSMKSMAIHVEDHPLTYSSFEGTIPAKQYGAGKVIVWDRGTWEPVGDPREGLSQGKLLFKLAARRLPSKLAPQLATLTSAAVPRVQWVVENKFDGYRLLARIVTLEAATLDLDASELAAASSAQGPATPPGGTVVLPGTTLQDLVQDIQRQAIRLALSVHQENWAAAARQLGLDASNLHKLARRLGLKLTAASARRTA